MKIQLSREERNRRDSLSHYQQMGDAMSMCLPCKLCGGAAKITDAGPGAGYYIECSNSTNWRDSTGCLINERRLGGWAYNVMDWWNRLHAVKSSKSIESSALKQIQHSIEQAKIPGNDWKRELTLIGNICAEIIGNE